MKAIDETNVLPIIEIDVQIEELEGIVAPTGVIVTAPHLGSGVIVLGPR